MSLDTTVINTVITYYIVTTRLLHLINISHFTPVSCWFNNMYFVDLRVVPEHKQNVQTLIFKRTHTSQLRMQLIIICRKTISDFSFPR